ncbi:hypothetical protein LIER_38872 [Lithospermum erythrorhizon]|uniref:Uncharacterized protein n=1 Tax=Lithospermum erythrorhizon TaxID=34254 RepID=A0AAV3Q7G2_LITER
MGFMIKDGVHVPKPPGVGNKRPRPSGVEPGRTSAGGGTSGGVATTTIEGDNEGVIDPAHGVLDNMWLSLYARDDIPSV